MGQFRPAEYGHPRIKTLALDISILKLARLKVILRPSFSPAN